MKEIICAAMMIMLAGCSPVISGGVAAEPTAEGWFNPQKTDLQLSQDRDYCRALCVSA